MMDTSIEVLIFGTVSLSGPACCPTVCHIQHDITDHS